MHSSLPQQLTNFAFSRLAADPRRLPALVERLMIRRSRVVIVICPSLEETVRGDRSATRGPCSSRTRRDRPRTRRRPSRRRPSARRSASARRRRSCSTPGTFEAYQGLDLLFEAMAHRPRGRGPTRGCCSPAASPTRWSGRASRPARPASATSTVFAGERPASEIPAYLLAADVLVSPRSRGTNTPLKIYQYLRSGKPIVATRLLTHTQVLDDETAILTGAVAARVRRRHPGRR